MKWLTLVALVVFVSVACAGPKPKKKGHGHGHNNAGGKSHSGKNDDSKSHSGKSHSGKSHSGKSHNGKDKHDKGDLNDQFWTLCELDVNEKIELDVLYLPFYIPIIRNCPTILSDKPRKFTVVKGITYVEHFCNSVVNNPEEIPGLVQLCTDLVAKIEEERNKAITP